MLNLILDYILHSCLENKINQGGKMSVIKNENSVLNPEAWLSNHTIATSNVIGFIENAVRIAEIEGFLNPIVMGTVLWLHLAAALMPDKADEINAISQSEDGIFGAIDKMQSDGIIQDLCENYTADVSYAFNLADAWYRQYAKFLPSFAGQIGRMSFLTQENVQEALDGVRKLAAEGDIEKVLEIANELGINNGNEQIVKPGVVEEAEPEPEVPAKKPRKKRTTKTTDAKPDLKLVE